MYDPTETLLRICPLLKALDVCYLNVLGGCLIDNHTTLPFSIDIIFVGIVIKKTTENKVKFLPIPFSHVEVVG